MSNIDRGRTDLADWVAAQPDNFYRADVRFQRTLERLGGAVLLDRIGARLDTLGAECATTLDAASQVNNRPHNLPRLERYDGIGRRIEAIEHHPSYHDCGRVIYESGMMGEYAEPGGFMRSLAMFYLTSMCGEAGHNCPVACTAGIIKSLQSLGTDALQQKYLPGLYSDVYDERLDGAQFLTEVQGGSDVGQNATRAVKHDDGTWRIHGEKWFCSNADADLILMTARFDDDVDGTRGLGLFLVPRALEDGAPNDYVVRRLKDKLGTRSMPSGEIDFVGAQAWALGLVEDGFKNMMRFVINTSRVYNAIAVAGAARRAMFVARGYAQHRRAFGHRIADFSLVQETVAELVAESTAITVGTFDLIAMFDAWEAGELDDAGQAVLRMTNNINKMRTAKGATANTLRGIEVLGGNGAIESFSVIPRLHRDMIVCENWEGTHNTLTAQVLRDMHRYRFHEAWLADVRARFGALDAPPLANLRAFALGRVDTLAGALDEVLAMPPQAASLRMRPLMDDMGRIWQLAALCRQAEHELAKHNDDEALAIAKYFAHHWLAGPGEALVEDELAVIARLAVG